MNAYLSKLPAKLVALSARISDRVLLETFETVDAAHRDNTGEPVTLPYVGTIPPGNLRTVWGWLVELVKSRHAAEWEALHKAAHDRLAVKVAESQGVTVDAIDWDAVPDGVWDSVPSALTFAVEILRDHVEGVA